MSNEISYLKYLENDNTVNTIAHRLQRMYNLFRYQEIYSKENVKVEALPLDQKVFIDLILDRINLKYNDIYDTSMMFEINDEVYKVFYLPYTEMEMLTEDFVSYSPIKKKDANTHIFVVGNKIIKEDMLLRYATCIAMDMINSCLGFDFGSIRDNKNNTRRFIDYSIILFKMLDSIFNLKFADYIDIAKSMGTKAFINLFDPQFSWIGKVYRFAINTDSTYDDYENLVVEIITSYRFKDFDRVFNTFSGMEVEQ